MNSEKDRIRAFWKVGFPISEVMFLSLKARKLYKKGTSEIMMSDRFMEFLVYELEDTTKNALQINNIWDEAINMLKIKCTKRNRFSPSDIEVIVNNIEQKFEPTIRALVSDNIVANEVVAFHQFSQKKANSSKF